MFVLFFSDIFQFLELFECRRGTYRWPKYSLPENSPRKVPPQLFPFRNIPSMKSMHGNNVVWLCAKYAVDANLFRLESSIWTRAKRATNRNNVGGEHSLGEYSGVERSGGNFLAGSIPRTNISVCRPPKEQIVRLPVLNTFAYEFIFIYWEILQECSSLFVLCRI